MGDGNTRFLYIIASQRQRRNLVDSMIIDGVSIEDPDLVR